MTALFSCHVIRFLTSKSRILFTAEVLFVFAFVCFFFETPPIIYIYISLLELCKASSSSHLTAQIFLVLSNGNIFLYMTECHLYRHIHSHTVLTEISIKHILMKWKLALNTFWWTSMKHTDDNTHKTKLTQLCNCWREY